MTVVLVGDKVGNVLAQEEFDMSTQFFNRILDFVRELVLLNVQVETVVNQRGRAFHKFHFTRIGRPLLLLLIGCDPRMFRLGGRYHASDIWCGVGSVPGVTVLLEPPPPTRHSKRALRHLCTRSVSLLFVILRLILTLKVHKNVAQKLHKARKNRFRRHFCNKHTPIPPSLACLLNSPLFVYHLGGREVNVNVFVCQTAALSLPPLYPSNL